MCSNHGKFTLLFGRGSKSPGLFIHSIIHSFIHSFIQAISIAHLQVNYHSEALPTQQGYCVGVSRRSATASEGFAQGPSVAARAGFEPATLRTNLSVSHHAARLSS